MENNFLYVCENEKDEANKCEFKIWKNNKLLGEEVDDLIFPQMNSEEGYKFERGIMRIDVNNPPFFTSVEWNNDGGGYVNKNVKLEFHLHEFTGKNGTKYAIWKEEITEASKDKDRKTVFQQFCGHDITEDEATALFNGETVSFEELKSKAGNAFSGNGTLEYDSDKQQWNIALVFNDK